MDYVSDLVESSLELVDRAGGVSDGAFREVAAALYGLEARYHHTSTVFRLREMLVRRGYLVEVPLEAHPAYEEVGESLEAASRRDPSAPTPVLADPSSDWDSEENPVVGYVIDETLVVQIGSGLWRELREAGELDDAGEVEPPEDGSLDGLVDAVDRVVKVAADAGEIEVLLGWYAALGYHLAQDAGESAIEDPAELTEDERLRRIRKRASEVDDLGMKMADPSAPWDMPPEALREAHPLLGWWYEGAGVG